MMTGSDDLFGDATEDPAGASTSRPPARPIGPAIADAATHDLGRRLPAQIHLGTSSWSFPGWAGIVYDTVARESQLAKNGLAAYARHPLRRRSKPTHRSTASSMPTRKPAPHWRGWRSPPRAPATRSPSWPTTRPVARRRSHSSSWRRRSSTRRPEPDAQARYFLRRAANFWRNFCTLGATTNLQYDWFGLRA